MTIEEFYKIREKISDLRDLELKKEYFGVWGDDEKVLRVEIVTDKSNYEILRDDLSDKERELLKELFRMRREALEEDLKKLKEEIAKIEVVFND